MKKLLVCFLLLGCILIGCSENKEKSQKQTAKIEAPIDLGEGYRIYPDRNHSLVKFEYRTYQGKTQTLAEGVKTYAFDDQYILLELSEDQGPLNYKTIKKKNEMLYNHPDSIGMLEFLILRNITLRF